ncbi:phosphatidylglycerophosphatase A family protein [Lacticaseibacillus sharpeae]|uniref:Putative low temperature requirement C protein (Putative) n=1 Tax=Lacticaseibacillus sharpeae JCM 1186 = DSM 20505 TaxID=1291052 RepID=A0A0R1ZST6_9LACO|nr:phosphatidylglycerophosphatase A [Lacticaseibacillus sharpeae]KRM54774.1 putative low temperature requirement C protein (putative) [Lacticaseibacillus sharpeae JCM 1186 = DSM 20505]
MVYNPNYKYPDTAAYKYVIGEFTKKNVTPDAIAEVVYGLQHKFLPDVTVDEYKAEVLDTMHKREFLNNAMVGLALDNLAAADALPQPLNDIITNDVGVFGVDETIALGVSQLSGSIGITNYGFLDRTKPGIINQLDNAPGKVNTFIDDLVGALASAVAGKMAHKYA